MSEKVSKSVYISEIPEGGSLEIRYKGRVIARRIGSSEIERAKD